MHQGYFWNTRRLALDLREGKVPRREMRHLLACGALATFAVLFLIWIRTVYMLLLWYPSQYTVSSSMAVIAVPLVTIIGFLACYRANSLGDGEDFIVRFIILNWHVGGYIVGIYFLAKMSVFHACYSLKLPLAYMLFFHDWSGVLLAVVYFALMRYWLIKISSTELSNESGRSNLCGEQR
ncbi:MAG: hypothetical protein V1792_16030 [Pseudomonadota bacterium]